MRFLRHLVRLKGPGPGALLAAAVLGGCATGTNLPLYMPLEEAKTHGYLETRLDERRYQVTYVAPRLRTYAYRTPERDRDADAQIALAYDLALWRTADLALAAGFPAFRVTNRTNDVRYDTRYGGYYRPYYPYDYPYFGRHHFFDPYPYYGAYGYADLVAQVTLEVEFAPEVAPDLFDARAVAERMRDTYPSYPQAPAPAGPAYPQGSAPPAPPPSTPGPEG